MPHVDALSALETEHLAPGEKPWCDLVFDVVGQTRTPSVHPDKEMLILEALGSTADGDVGVAIDIPMGGWNLYDRGSAPIDIYGGRIRICSIGEPTKRLVRLYQQWFEGPSSGAAFTTLDCFAAAFEYAPHKGVEYSDFSIKLFLESDSEDEYAEFFLKLDLPVGRLHLREKDPQYRAPFLSWLSGVAPRGRGTLQ